MIARPSRAACAHTRAYQSPPSLPNASLPSNLITFSAPLVSRKIRAIDYNGSSAANRRTLHYGSSCRDIAVTSPENRERRLFVSFCFVFSCVVFSFLSFVFSLPFLFLFFFLFYFARISSYVRHWRSRREITVYPAAASLFSTWELSRFILQTMSNEGRL